MKDTKKKKIPGGALVTCAVLYCAKTVIVYGVLIQTAVPAIDPDGVVSRAGYVRMSWAAVADETVSHAGSVRLYGAGSGIYATDILVELGNAAAGAAVVFILLIFAVFFCEILLKRKLMGGADIKIFVLLGAWFGAWDGIMIVFLTCLFALPSAAVCLFHRKPKDTFALVPSIFLAVWASLIFF